MLPYNPHLKQTARHLRKNMTDSERALWRGLRGKQMWGVQFYRQKPIGRIIVDFYAPKVNLVVEVDGSPHFQRSHHEQDKHRDIFLESMGLKVLRFNNYDALVNTDIVLDAIFLVVEKILRTGQSP